MSRAIELVAAAKLRAQITACVAQSDHILTIDEIASSIKMVDNEQNKKRLFALVYRMADSGLIAKVPIEHPDYTYGYAPSDSVFGKEPIKPTAKSKDIPIDVRINKRQGSITIRYAGLLITLSKED